MLTIPRPRPGDFHITADMSPQRQARRLRLALSGALGPVRLVVSSIPRRTDSVAVSEIVRMAGPPQVPGGLSFERSLCCTNGVF